MTMSALSLSLDMACTNEHRLAELAHLKIKQVMNMTEMDMNRRLEKEMDLNRLAMIMAERKKQLQKEIDVKNKVMLEKRKKGFADFENVKTQFMKTETAKRDFGCSEGPIRARPRRSAYGERGRGRPTCGAKTLIA